MAFPLDASQPFLLPSQLRRLAEAVRDAGPHDEATWIEWKSTLDLRAPHARVHLVKQTLGFGNRPPDEAAKRAGGYGYLLVGVEPGSVSGVDSIDPSDMEQDLTPYLGPDLVWSAEHVTLDGKDVLIVVVNPPRFGDPIHYLRKGLPHSNPSKGARFVHAEPPLTATSPVAGESGVAWRVAGRSGRAQYGAAPPQATGFIRRYPSADKP
ncbi:helix-turn-helix domain-containing protein [Actinomadura luteofluorescens]|uniref:helix-turn-helix domain-containing protein n=1 Tax=Actinomadura luteofluorescens TaxID=46163 RepID=UPI003479AB7D